ncbi:TIGR03905 family TSCPD domain-containing protein [Pseudoflavonifractor sp. CLA-AP-H29]|uniref:ribonucleoside-diphosphate reductase n=1 Tax=Pseudoflavonifractor intestinihominis TaxID=3133171 RepID=A0ABV1ECA5_9FIRM
MHYQTKGTCAKEIHVEVDHGVIRSVEFVLGCPGFTQALSRLLVGIRVEDAIARLKGIQCLDKGTSCPDQLALALMQIQEA